MVSCVMQCETMREHVFGLEFLVVVVASIVAMVTSFESCKLLNFTSDF